MSTLGIFFLSIFLFVSLVISFPLVVERIEEYKEHNNNLKHLATPAWFYSHTKMNYFGCFISSMLVLPFLWVYYIVLFLVWLSHVGRKN